MAKKSARSKGYRKQTVKKPYLSKKEIIWTVVIVAVLILGVVLFNLLYDDGSLKVVDGVAQTEGANSLVYNGGTSSNPRYFKLGQLSDVEGYTLEGASINSDENVYRYVYTPVGDSPIDEISFNAYAYSADAMSSAMMASFSSASEVECSELQTAEINGHKVSYFTYRAVPEAPDAQPAEEAADTETNSEEAAQPQYVQALNAYVGVGDHSIIVHVRNDTESADGYVEDSILVDALNATLAALSFETK